MEHTPIYRNNALDYAGIVKKMKEIAYEGPIVCELQGNDIRQACEAVLEARELIIKLWRGGAPREDVKPWNLMKML